MLGDSADSGGSARGESSIRAGDFQAFNAPLCPVCCKKLSIHEQAIDKTCAEKRCKDQRPSDVLQTYMAHLGGKTYDQSCVFHGEGGCRLPREMRSHICNDYHCKGLNDLIYQLPDSASRRAFVVATSGQTIVRSAFIDQEPATEEPGQERSCGQRR